VQGNLPAFPYYRLGPIDGSACDTLGLNNVPIANFRYYPDTLEQHKIKFIDNSSYLPTDWLWTFGDGSGKTSTEVNPIYTYAKGGVYEVCETVSNAYGQDTYCRYVRVGTVATQEELLSSYFSLYPNPATNQLTIDLNENMNPEQAYDIKLYDLQGSTRYKGIMPAYAYVHTIDVQGLASGMYILELSDRNGKVLRRKFLKE
jgi:PKD repeat protein